MAIDGEVWTDLDALLAAARDSRTSPDACQRLLAFLSARCDLSSLLVGSSTDREQLLRIYRRRAQRALPDGRLPDGTHELVRQLEHETGSEIVLIALSSEVQFAYIFARRDLRSLVGCVVGEPSPRVSQRRARIEQALLTRSADTSSVLQWLSVEESRTLAEHWVHDLGAAEYGRLALPPSSNSRIFGRFSPGQVPSWLVKSADSALIIFSDYRNIGIARCSWELIRENLTALAEADGEGYAAVFPELTGVVTVDLEPDEHSINYEIMAWGDVVEHKPPPPRPDEPDQF
jgi:hypothetical protein